MSPARIAALLKQASEDVFHAHGFSERDLDIAYIIKALGGPKLLYAMQKAYGVASLSTLFRNRPTPRLLPCLSIPTVAEFSANITAILHPDVTPGPPETNNVHLVGVNVMIDDIHLDCLARYDPFSGSVVGLCRECVHRLGLDLKLDSLEKINDLKARLDSDGADGIHLAPKATVIAIAPLGREDHYSGVSLLVSPSDGSEKGDEMAIWIEDVLLRTWDSHEYGQALHGAIWVISTDGDGAFRRMKHIVCTRVHLRDLAYPKNGVSAPSAVDEEGVEGSWERESREAFEFMRDPNNARRRGHAPGSDHDANIISEARMLYNRLVPLKGLNLYVGRSLVWRTADHKHINKRQYLLFGIILNLTDI